MTPTRGDRFACMGKLLGVLAVFAGVSFAINALDDDGTQAVATTDNDGAAGANAAQLGDLEGQFLVSGSSTVFPIVQRQAEAFGVLAPGVAISVEGPGSGDGARKFCAGEVPIGNASRAYKDEELAICEQNGIEFIEILRGIDGISVITSTENDAIECLSFNQIYALLSEESSRFDTWADANALLAEMGSTAEPLPDVALDIFGPGEESGTFDSFAEIVIHSVAAGKTGLDADERDYVENIRPDYTSSPDDNVVMEGVEASQYSLGWVGFAYAQESAEAGRAKLLAISSQDDGACVTPTPETIAAAEFPIARFLYTYINADDAINDPSVQAFVDYMLSDEGLESVSAVGYIDLPPDEQEKAQQIWSDRLTGRQYE